MRKLSALVAAVVLSLAVVSPALADRNGPSDPIRPYFPPTPLEGCIYTMSALSAQKGINPPMDVIVPFCKSLVS